MRALADAWQVLVYALRGGQQDALEELRSYREMTHTLRVLDADLPRRLQHAAGLEAVGMTDGEVQWVLRAKATGQLEELMKK